MQTLFDDWIAARINEYGFLENHDFLITLSKTPNGGRPSQDFIKLHKKIELSKTGQMGIEYYITLDMAKNSVGWQPAQDSV